MTKPSQLLTPPPITISRRTILLVLLLCTLVFAALQPAPAQTFTVLHTFTGGSDGSDPTGGLTMGGAGTFYGTASSGGTGGTGNNGVVFKLSLRNSNWFFSPIYEFTDGSDGYGPVGGITIGPTGALYGSADNGSHGAFGTVFTLTPALTTCKSALCYWNETTLYTFANEGASGAGPTGKLTFDQAGSIYGATEAGGPHEGGVVFELSPSNGGWTQTVLHGFGQGSDGISPSGGLVFDTAGNLYGTTPRGGAAQIGSVFELTPAQGGWTETILYDFPNGGDGYQPLTGLVIDAHGNLYGTTGLGGSGGGGTVFQLTPSGGHWVYSVLYSFHGRLGPVGGSLIMDSAGNLYGTTSGDGASGFGMVFKLSLSNGSWTLTDLYDFMGTTDGKYPDGVFLDSAGNLYGTASEGGDAGRCNNDGCGTVWEITP
jgi:uncharacterized repeat protein (TIGR03803 family)